jgi:outer membrane protein assembly factor BamB
LAAALLLPAALARGWQTTLDRSLGGQAYVMAVDKTGDAIAAGVIYGTTAEEERFTVVKLRGTDGGQVWLYQGPAPLARAIALDGDDVIAAGFYFYTMQAGSSGMVVRLSGVTGQEIWRVNRPGIFVAPSLVVDSAGDIIIATGQGDGQPVTIAKLSGDDGTERWQRTLSSAPSAAIVLQPNGDVVVGATPVVALAGRTGDIRWTAHLHNDQVGTLFSTPRGDPVVGTFHRPNGEGQSYRRILRLSGTTGVVRWKSAPGRLFPLTIRNSGDIVAAHTVVRRLSEQEHLVMLRGNAGVPAWHHGLPVDTYELDSTSDYTDDLLVTSAYANRGAGQYPPQSSLTVKLRGGTGQRLWVRHFDDKSLFGEFVGQAIGTDAHADVLLAGYGAGSRPPMTFAVIKLDGATGADYPAR